MNITRAEHMAWCKKRALEYINEGDIRNGLLSMISDLGKHDETKNHGGITLTTMLMMNGNIRTKEEARKHIEGFN